MIRIAGIGLWIAAVALGSVFLSMQMAAAPKADAAAAAREAAFDFVSGYVTTVPVIGEGGVDGYLLTKLSYKADRELAARQPVPLPQMITDELYTLLMGNRMIDVANAGGFDLDAFRAAVKEGLNRRFGAEVIDEVLVEQIDYVTTAAVRDPGQRRSTTLVKGADPASRAPEKAH